MSTTKTMKAAEIAHDRTVKVIELPKPEPKDDEVLVKVLFSAIDTAADAVLDKTWMGTFTHSSKRPLVLGWHFAGEIQKLGNVDSSYKIGDKIWGHLQYEPGQTQGSLAQFITVKEDACALIPSTVSYQLAAAASTEAITALQAMRDLGGLQKGMKILVVGAGGGVGSVAVGIAKRLGAHVTAVCSTKDVDRVTKLGADVVIDRTKKIKDPLAQRDAYHVILDAPNALPVRRSLSAIKANGAYVATLPSWGLLTGYLYSWLTSKKVTYVECMSKKDDLELIGKWLSDGLEVAIDSEYKISDLGAALERQNTRSKVGRVVVKVLGGWK